MPRVSKRNKKRDDGQKQGKYYRTYVYVRLSNKDGGHGREETIYTQKQVCLDFAAKHPELLVEKTYADNGVTGTTFARPEFELLMEDVRAGKVDCIIVKDFSRFGRDALEAVDLLDVVFPSLNVRFISVLDEYDSENPVCVQDRVTNILKHFMNDYYAREVSVKLVQAHQISREKGEFWGARPPYGYERSQKSSKVLVPEPTEKEVVHKIFSWFVLDGMSSYDIAKELNSRNLPSPAESYEIRVYGKMRTEKRRYWRPDGVRKILQNPVYIGCAVYGKTKQRLSQNLPLLLMPKKEWELKENVWEAVIERPIFDMAQEILLEHWKASQKKWGKNQKKVHAADGPFLGKVYCGTCGRGLARTNQGLGDEPRFYYYCPTVQGVKKEECPCYAHYINEKILMKAVEAALRYQIGLAVDFKKKYGAEFYERLEQDSKEQIEKSKKSYETYHIKLTQLFEHYASGILDKVEYLEIKKDYLSKQQEAQQKLVEMKRHYQILLDTLKEKMAWAEALIKCRKFKKINRGIVERFIAKIFVNSLTEIAVEFWFCDIFEASIIDEMGGTIDEL